MKWTDRQKEAIEQREKNILVAAAAGSGKTAVLVERILQLILEENVNVEELLVVTFTKAAAAEMKGKINTALKREIEEENEQSAFLRNQLNNMHKASISTFHSFALDIIRKYFYTIDINPNLRIASETQTVMMKINALDEVFSDEFQRENNEDFITFLKNYSSHKTEENLKKSLLELYNRIMAIPNPLQWLNESVELIKESRDFRDGVLFDILKNEIEIKLSESFEIKKSMVELLNESGLLKMASAQADDINKLEVAIDCIQEERYDDLREVILNFKSPALRAGKDEKEGFEEIKDIIQQKKKIFAENIKTLKETYLYDSFENMFEEVFETYQDAKVLESLINKFHCKYMADKIEKEVIDFTDIEHYAIKILENEEVARECRNKYKHIFIDEYQDSNLLQESIINKIKNENNLFMVGDIKQSIYRFRLAEPDIFRGKYELYAMEDKINAKIDLNQNFRSKKTIIDFINEIFENIMNGYDENAALYLGVNSDSDYNFPIEIDIVNMSTSEDSNLSEELDIEFEDIKTAEFEAMATVKKIEEIIGTDYYDHKAGDVKQIQYSDIVVLMRGIKGWGETFKEVLERNNIPVFLNNSTGYFDTIEVRLILDLLKVIDNINQDISLIGVLKSRVFEFSINELIEIRLKDKKISFSKAFRLYAKEGKDEKLKYKCDKTLKTLRNWKNTARYTPIENFVWNVIHESGIYSYAGTLSNGEQRQLNMRTFLDKTMDYSKMRDNSIYGFLQYFEKVKQKVEVGQVSITSEEDNTVQITTIHKSKGLEYPVVIIPGLAKRFRFDTISEIGMSHKDLGIAIGYSNHDEKLKKTTIAQKIMQSVKNKESMEEELRILYVAMTRAKDRLVLIGNVKDIEVYKEKATNGVLSENCFLDYIYPHLNRTHVKERHLDVGGLTQYSKAKEERADFKGDVVEFIEKAKLADPSKIAEVLEFQYPYNNELKVKSKYTVSEINKKDIFEYEKKISIPTFATGEIEIKGSALGTIYHKIMEHLSFEKVIAGEIDIEAEVKRMVERELLIKEELEAVNIQKIEDFFKSDIGKRAGKSKTFKEQPFTMKYDVDGVEAILQGVIDCYFEEDGEYILLDYKSNYLTDGIENLYKDQLKLYKNALEEYTTKNVKEVWLYLFEKGEGIRIL